MFAFAGILIAYALIVFGAPQPHSWLLIGLLWLIGIAVFLIVECVRGSGLTWYSAMALLFLAGVWSLDERHAIIISAGAWCWLAAKREGRRLTLFFHVLLLFGLLEAALGLFQYFVEPGWIFGYQNLVSRSSGTLINRNHFAGVLEMTIPVAFGLAYTSARQYSNASRSYLYLLSGAFMGLALFFSLSRMGIISFLLTLFFLSAVVQFRNREKGLGNLLAIALFAMVLAGALWIGIGIVLERYADLLQDEAILQEGRGFVFRDTLNMIVSNPLGIGVGNYRDVFRAYQTFRPDLLFDHAHNDYLETVAELGLPLASAFWAFVFFVLWRSVRSILTTHPRERRGFALGCAGALFSILVHSLADFNLQIPSNAMLFFVFLGIASALTPETSLLWTTKPRDNP